MGDWDKFRRDVDRFDNEYELSRFDEFNVRPYSETIKELKKLRRISRLMAPGTYRLNRRIFIPRENARQRATYEGILKAIKEAVELFQDSDKYARDYYGTLVILSRKIAMRRRELSIARTQLDENELKKIYKEMFLTVEISFLISAWRKFLNQDENF